MSLKVSSLTKIYGNDELAVAALRGVSFTISPGEFVALVGPSGSGKSTLLNIVGLCDSPTSGTVEILGERVERLKERQLRITRLHQVGFIFQSHNLISHLTAEENVALPLILQGCSFSQSTARARDLLTKVGLGRRLNHLPSQLSGGEAQRAGVARALIHNPPMIVADEPTGSLDTESGRVVLELLQQAAHQGVVVLMATHSELARDFADRVLEILDGKLMESQVSVDFFGQQTS